MNRRVGSYYFCSAIVLVALSLTHQPWTLGLLWPAMSVSIVAIAYFGAGPRVYGKSHEGQIPFAVRLLLWPVFLGHRISLLHYARRSAAWNVLGERVWIGRVLSNREAQHAVKAGVTAVLDLTAEFSETNAFRSIHYRSIPILDLTAPTPRQIDDAVSFIQERSATGIVYIHCKIGYSRTAAVAGAYLLHRGDAATSDSALSLLRAARLGIIIRPEAAAAIRRYHSDAIL